MQQQMLFTRVGAWQQDNNPVFPDSTNNSCSPRCVTFTMSPSSMVHRSGQKSSDLPPTFQVNQRQQQKRRPRPQPKTQQRPKQNKTASVHFQPQRPAWNADVNRGETVFDASLKKSLLFQSRRRDRRNDEQEHKSQFLTPHKEEKRTSLNRNKSTSARTPIQYQYRSGPSSVYAQQRQKEPTVQRRRKDFVRQNIENCTGRFVPSKVGRPGPRSKQRENVFERLSAPRGSQVFLQSIQFKGNSTPTTSSRRSSNGFTPQPAVSLTFKDPSVDESASISPKAQRLELSSSSPEQSHSTNGALPTERMDNYPARVFEVLDRENHLRIGVNQILQGLRLLGLPATHNQISDYVYLIHEGQHKTIDLEEWEILVGTLDAASRPPDHPRDHENVLPDESVVPPRSFSIQNRSESAVTSSNAISPYTNSDHHQQLNQEYDGHYGDEEDFSASSQRERTVAAANHSISEDDPYLEEIQNRIQGMFETAQATAALRWAPGLGNNQLDDEVAPSKSDRILKHAASVVYNLRASLFPLVHQAEATLREIQQRHGSRLSLFLPPRDMAAIAQNSDVLASAILDDILLDTVQLLNDEDKLHSRRQLSLHHATHLDEILARIEEIEKQDDNLMHQRLALSYETPSHPCDLSNTPILDTINRVSGSSAVVDDGKRPNLTLPLEVVMNLEVSESDACWTPHSKLEEVEKGITAPSDLRVSDFDTARLETWTKMPIRSSILDGKRLQSIERRKHKFEHHRRLVESSLAESGLTQVAVIEILEEMVVDDLVEESAAEFNDMVSSMSDMLVTHLL